MTLRGKLLLAQAPLAAAVAVLAVVFAVATARLGHSSSTILKDNYRSVLAAQRMKEAVERIDSTVLFGLAGRPAPDGAAATLPQSEQQFETELQAEEGNITEPGEGPAARELRQAWTATLDELRRYRALDSHEARLRAYFDALVPAFARVRAGADQILAINQDAMVRKSDRAQRSAHGLERTMIALALLIGALAIWASASTTARLLRPLGVVKQAVRRFGEGDLATRAQVRTRDEIGDLAEDFNTMADSLERYRSSSLGELLQAQRASQAAIDSLTDPVVMVGLVGVLNVNEAATRLLGIGLEAGALDALERVDPAVRAAIERLRTHVLSGRGSYQPKSFDEAVRVSAADGEHWLLPRASPIYGEEGEVSGVALVFADVTRYRRADELKNDLVAFVAHELRTPLTSLQMAIHLCAEEVAGPLTEKQADLLFAARQDCERLQEIVNDLLDVSRMQEGHIELQTEVLDAEALIAHAVDAHEAAAKARGVELRSEVLPDAGRVVADPERVGIVLGNLFSNALRHTPPGGHVAVRTSQVGDALRFEVSDTGAGIPPEQRTLVFEKFYRAPGTRSEGIGLGLFMSRQIVEAHGGAMGVESELGHGSTFWFTLPLATAEAQAGTGSGSGTATEPTPAPQAVEGTEPPQHSA